MKKKDLCPHCGASMMVNKYSMNLALLRALYKLASNPGKPCSEIGLSKVEYSVYTKLKHWDLIESRGEDGLWFITKWGSSFLMGHSQIPREIHYFRNRVIETSNDNMIDCYDILKTEESKQKYRDLMEPIRNYL